MRSFPTLTRILLVLLSLCLVLSAFAACAAEEDETLETEATESDGSDDSLDDSFDEDLYDENGYLKDQIPDEDLNYENEELKILCWASPANEFACDEYNGQAINDALVRRDLSVEERLDVNLHYLTELSGGGGNAGDESNRHLQYVKAAADAGTPYDILAVYGRTSATLSYQGYLTNIMNIDYSYLNFENPWWTQNLLDELMVGNSLFLLSGDISPSIYEQPYIMFYNVDMMENYGLKDPYDCVKDNTWTIETFRETIKNITVDQNGKQMYGVVSSYYTVPALVYGCAIRIMERDDEALLKLSDELFSEKTIGLVDDTMTAWAKEDNFIVANSSGDARKLFTNGEALFLIDRMIECFNFNNLSDFSYSVAPTPKYNEEQDRYYVSLDTQITVYSLMQGLSSEDLTMISAVLECMASESYRRVSPAVVENCLEGRYAQSEQMAEMIRVIIDGVFYDFGRIYSGSATDYLCDKIGVILKDSKKGGTLTWAGYKNQSGEYLNKQFQMIVDKYVELGNR